MGQAGELLASLKLRDPSRVKKILPFTGEWKLADPKNAEAAAEVTLAGDLI
jgi:hypothetical protein